MWAIFLAALMRRADAKGEINVDNRKNRGFRCNYFQHCACDRNDCRFCRRTWRRLHPMRWQQIIACQMYT
jgi:hypothetical protein